jgi:hypothetical protein
MTVAGQTATRGCAPAPDSPPRQPSDLRPAGSLNPPPNPRKQGSTTNHKPALVYCAGEYVCSL